jgi:Ni/Fe-hydrogenase subunit HybB-like protein
VSGVSIPGAAAAAAAAVFTGPLFSQGAGRDLWDGWDSVPALLFQALVEGAAMCLLVICAIGVPGVDGPSHAVVRILAGALVAHACALAVGVVPRRADTRHRQLALAAIRQGPFGRAFWGGAVGAGIAVPVALIAAAALGLPQVFLAGASALAVAGTCAWHYVWVEAGQSVPLS